MLDSLTVERHEVLLYLARAPRSFFVQRYADTAVRGGHGFRQQAGVLALDVEVSNLAKVEYVFVKLGPEIHATAIDVMS